MNHIQTLWVGDLSDVERLCAVSFLQHGHEYHLYTYHPLSGVPAGVRVCDANTIVPERAIDQFQNLANFSDYFRYKVLLKHGGYWADMDVCCVQAFPFGEPYILATQLVVQRTKDEVTSCVIKAPSDSPLLHWCVNQIAGMNTKTNPWSALGPALLLKGSWLFKLQDYIKGHRVFCPLHYFEAPANVYGQGSEHTVFGPDTFAVHLWNEERRRAGWDKEARYPGSLYERLKKEYGLG